MRVIRWIYHFRKRRAIARVRSELRRAGIINDNMDDEYLCEWVSKCGKFENPYGVGVTRACIALGSLEVAARRKAQKELNRLRDKMHIG